jgi:hypothetical protein
MWLLRATKRVKRRALLVRAFLLPGPHTDRGGFDPDC